MASTSTVRWEIIRGIGERMVSDFFVSLVISEGELMLDGVVQMLIDGVQDTEDIALEEFAASRIEEFREYAEEKTGDAALMQTGSRTAVLMFIADRGLMDEYHSFRADNEYRWNKFMDGDSVRERIVERKLAPLFDQLNKNSIYIYRDSDHWGVHLRRVLLQE